MSSESLDISGRTILEFKEDIIHEGSLWKRGGGHKSKAWRKRYCILTVFGLSYFKTDGPKERPRGTVHPLANFEIMEGASSPGMQQFHLTPKTNSGLSRDYSFHTKTAEERDTWIRMLSQVQGGRRRTIIEYEEDLNKKGVSIPNNDLIVYDHIIAAGVTGDVRGGLWNNTTEVAVKMLYKGIDISVGHLILFYKDMLTLYSLRHPEVVKMYGFCKRDDCLCVVTEFVKGGNMRHLTMGQGEPAITEVINILLSVTRAMIFLHSKSIIHRHLKPENILINDLSKGLVKVSGFGIKNSNDIISTTSYAAPELRTGKPFDNKVDVFSFGIIAWELTMQKKAYNNIEEKNIPEAIAQGIRPDISSSHILHGLITKCWTPDSRHRPTFDQIYTELTAMKNAIEALKNPGMSNNALYQGYTPQQNGSRRETTQPSSDIVNEMHNIFRGNKSIDWNEFAQGLSLITNEDLSSVENVKFVLCKQSRVSIDDWNTLLKWFTPLVVNHHHDKSAYNMCDIFNIAGKEWFHGTINAGESRDILHQQPIGSYLIRFSSQPKNYTISVRFKTTCSHWRITADKNNNGTMFTMGTRVYKTLDELITRHMEDPLEGEEDGKVVQYCLRAPADRRMTYHYVTS